MVARIADYVGSRIARTLKQGKMACLSCTLWAKAHIGDEDLKRQALGAMAVLGLAAGSWCLGRLSMSPTRSSAAESSVEMQDVFKDAQDRFACRPQNDAQGREEGIESPSRPEGSVVGSKNGSKYHLPRCSGANSIKEENKIWFASESAAQAAGYTRAGNCK